MTEKFNALVVDKQNEEFSVKVKELTFEDLQEGEVLIQVHYSGVNYKDSLAANPDGKIIREYPAIPGIDLAGRFI